MEAPRPNEFHPCYGKVYKKEGDILVIHVQLNVFDGLWTFCRYRVQNPDDFKVDDEVRVKRRGRDIYHVEVIPYINCEEFEAPFCIHPCFGRVYKKENGLVGIHVRIPYYDESCRYKVDNANTLNIDDTVKVTQNGDLYNIEVVPITSCTFCEAYFESEKGECSCHDPGAQSKWGLFDDIWGRMKIVERVKIHEIIDHPVVIPKQRKRHRIIFERDPSLWQVRCGVDKLLSEYFPVGDAIYCMTRRVLAEFNEETIEDQWFNITAWDAVPNEGECGCEECLIEHGYYPIVMIKLEKTN